MKKEYTINDFRVNTYAYKPIVDDGRRGYYSGKYEVNYSSILTRLIQEAGRFCERFASDLFIDWESVVRWIDNADKGDEIVFLFGFRQDGVDGNSFILSRYNNGCYSCPEKEYRSMWRLDIRTGCNNDFNDDEIKLTLGRVF